MMRPSRRTTTPLSLQWVASTIAVILLLTANTVSALAVFDNTVRCEAHPILGESEGLNVCVGSLEYYYLPFGANTGYSWIYTFVDEFNNDRSIGERVFVATDLAYTNCLVGLGYPSTTGDGAQLCQSCSYCGADAGGPDERTNGLFKADCTNLAGGRKIDTCESTYPYFYPVDWYSDEYLNQGSTMIPDTMAPSDANSYEASGMGTTSSDDSDASSDSQDSSSKDDRTFDSPDEIKPRSGALADNCVEMIQNGGFETGSFGTEWMTETDADENCIIGLNDGSTAPFPFIPVVFTSAQDPIVGNWDVFTQQENPGMCKLKQVVSGLPENIQSATLSWQDRIFSYAEFADPGTEARVRVCLCDHDDDVAALEEVWSTDPGDTKIQAGPNPRSFDVTDLVKGMSSSVDIIFEQQEDFNFFNMYWDEISLVVCTEDPSATTPTTTTTSNYRYQSEMTITMDVSPDSISTLDAEIVLEKYKGFLREQPSLGGGGGTLDEIDLVFQSHDTTTVTRLDGKTVGRVLIEFESKLGVTTAADETIMTPRQVATSMANGVDWGDFIVNYLRNTEGGAFKRTGKVHLKLIGEGRRGRNVRKLGSSSLSSFEVNGEGSSSF